MRKFAERLKPFFFAAGVTSTACLCTCTTAPAPLYGALFTNVKFDGIYNPNNDVARTKRGEGCIKHVLYLAAWGDASVGSIAEKNGIKRIAMVDHTSTEFLFIYGKFCTIVTGE